MAGETSLARQLKKLAVPQTRLFYQGKIRKSLLFDHRDAAAIDLDEYFNHGTTGLEKLCLIYPEFKDFEKDLFSVSYKNFERSVQTADVNQKLDTRIKDFLRTLSPFFLNTAAIEALEWLVYRFNIHLFNTDALVACALPYFYIGSFVKVLQLLDLDDPNSSWNWLKPIQKAETHLEFSVIINRFNSDFGFLEFVCNLAPEAFKKFEKSPSFAVPIISFSMLTAYNALDKGKVTDETVGLILKYILKGLKSKFDKYEAASCLVITKLVTKVKLKEDIIWKLMNTMIEKVQTSLLEKAVELLAVIFQYQDVKSVPVEFFRLMLYKEECVHHLVYVSQNYESTTLLSAILERSVSLLLGTDSGLSRKSETFLTKICEFAMLSEKTIQSFLKSIFGNYLEKLKINKSLNKYQHRKASSLLKSLENKYPDFFDKAISDYFKKNENKKLQQLLNDSVECIEKKLVPNLSTTLILGVNHVNDSIRKSSVQYLLKLATETKYLDKADTEFLKSTLHDRLNDEDPAVVNSILSHQKILFQYADMKDMMISFYRILQKIPDNTDRWFETQQKCLKILTVYNSDDEDFSVFIGVVIFLFPMNRYHIEELKNLLTLKGKDKNVKLLLQNMHSYLKDSIEMELLQNQDSIEKEQLFNLNYIIFNSIKKYLVYLPFSSIESFLSFIEEQNLHLKSNAILVVYLSAIHHAIISAEPFEKTLQHIQKLLLTLQSIPQNEILRKTFIESEMDVLKKCLNALKKGRFPGIYVFHIISKIVRHLKLNFDVNQYSLSWINDTGDNNHVSYKILKALFDYFCEHLNCTCVSSAENVRKLLSLFMECHFKSAEHIYGFLSIVWSNICSDSSNEIQVYALKTFTDYVSSENSKWFFDNPAYFFTMLVALHSDIAPKRLAAMTVLGMLLKNAGECVSATKSLAEFFYQNIEEVITDHRQCHHVLTDWLGPLPEHLNFENSDAESKDVIICTFIQTLQDVNIPDTIKHCILSYLGEADSVLLLNAYAPLIDTFLEKCKDMDSSFYELHCDILKLLLKKFTPCTAKSLRDNSVEAKVMFNCLECIEKNSSASNSVLLILKAFSKEFFINIPAISVQKQLLDKLLKIYITCTSDVNAHVKKVLRKLSTYAYLIFKDEESFQGGKTLREMKKSRKMEVDPCLDLIDSEHWKKLMVLLEITQGKSKLEKRELLVPELLNLLNKSLSFDTKSTVEYIRQLILATLYNCWQHLGNEGLDERHFQVELIVQCIRSSTNPKTHHQALLLLNLASTIFPDYVLSNVMSVFTFMGSSLIRQDDSYSFQVISQTIETIVPSLLSASNLQKDKNGVQIVAAVIRVFVDSLMDIPKHRQLPLFTKLINTLDSSEYLWLPLGQICDRYASMFDNLLDDNIGTATPSALDFGMSLHKQFSPDVQMKSCINLLHFLGNLPDSRDSESTTNLTEPFDIKKHSDLQIKMYKYNVLLYINLWLSSEDFLTQVSDLSSSQQQSLGEKYKVLLEMVLQFLQKQRAVEQSTSEDCYSLLPHLFSLVGHINALLPSKLFIKIVRKLLHNSESAIQKKTIDLLNVKLERNFFNEDEHPLLVKLVKPLLKILKSDSDLQEKDHVAYQQTALYSLHLLTRIISSNYPQRFNGVINCTVQILKDNRNQELTVNALLCLAQVCISLNVEILPWLNTFMPIILSLISDCIDANINEGLVVGIIATLQSLIENVGMFLSSYMQSIVLNVCLLSVKCQTLNKYTIQEKVHKFITIIATEISLRILLTTFENVYEDVCAKDPTAITPLMDVLTEKLNCCSYEEIVNSSFQLEKYCILILGFRHNHSELNLSVECVSSVEISIISTLKVFVMKLSVTQFRLFFQKIFLWATSTEGSETSFKIFTFYNLTCELSKSLKNLFITVARFFLRHAASTLDAYNFTKNSDVVEDSLAIQLLKNILDTLNSCFEFGDGRLIDKDIFDVLLQPLVDQMENFHQNGEIYQDFIANHLCTCIGRFMSTVSDSTLWKKLNYEILLKTRNDSAIVRFAAVQVVREVVNIMGDNYLVLLPESIPFLAEVMEDESSEVEKECQNVIAEMEKVLGEPIRKYF